MLSRTRNPALVKTLLSEQIMQILTERITDFAYPQGTRIDIEAIKKEYGISHIPVRDALHKLAEQGLVTVVPRIGYFVVQFTREEVEDLLRVRALLELSALHRDLKNIDKRTLRFLVNEYRACKLHPNRYKTNAIRLYELGEMLHHDVILRNAASPLTEKIYAGLLTKIRIATRIKNPDREDIDEHMKIIRALLHENGPAARKALNEHIAAVQKRSISRLKEPAPRSGG
jgi:DNA-binding GntR family transcriptional regulator